MSDGRALLAAICANPDEDTPRLAYADWLDEYVGAMPKDKRESVRMRAELIRVQCELSAMSPEEEDADTATRRVELELREAALLKNPSRRRSWVKPFGPAGAFPALPANTERFVRGFPQFPYAAGVENYLSAGAALFDVSPVHSLDCSCLHGAAADRFYAAPWLPRLRRLTAQPYAQAVGPSAASSERVFAEPGLAGLEELELRDWEFRAPGEPVMNRALANLRALELATGTWNGPATFERLGELLPVGARLRGFNLGDEDASASDLTGALGLPQFRVLERLTFGGCAYRHCASTLGADGVRALAGSPCWATLRALHDRDQMRLRTADVAALAACPPAPNLRSLTLASGDLGATVDAALAWSPVLGSVTALDVSRSRHGDAGAGALARSPYLGRLVSLNVEYTDIGPNGLKRIAAAPWAANLVRLNVNGCPIRKAGVEVLVSAAFPRLKRVDAVWAAKNTSQKQRLRERFGDGVRFD